jgi:DNA-binding transcriptional LysR family regulator
MITTSIRAGRLSSERMTKGWPTHPALSLDQVRSFVTVAEERHFGRAAQRLRLTQPPLSRQVQKLEREVGARLLDRTPHGVELTAAGRAFLPDARRLLALAEAAVRGARRAAAGGAGELAVGFTALSGLTVLGEVLALLEAARPGVRVSLHEWGSAAQLDLLGSGALDLALVRPPFDPHVVESRLVAREPLLVAVPAGHALADGETSLPVDRLAGATVLGHAAGRSGYLARLVELALRPVRHEVSDEVDEVHTMLALAAAGRGLAVVPASARELGLAGVAFRRLVTDPPEPVELHLVWRRGATNPALLAVLPDLVELARRASEVAR